MSFNITNKSIWGSICSRENIMNKDKIILENEPYCLRLPLRTKWFEMTKAGIKTEDYREINYYWIKRFFYLVNSDVTDFIEYLQNPSYYKTAMDIYLDKNNIKYKPFTQNTITLGYPKLDDAERILNIEHKGIEIRTGNPEWGAESSKVYFVIKHGEVIK